MNAQKNTHVPRDLIPLIIIHWWWVYYYGGGTTILGLRKFFEKKLREHFFSEEAVRAWIRNAEGWKILQDAHYPGRVEAFLKEYNSIHVVT